MGPNLRIVAKLAALAFACSLSSVASLAAGSLSSSAATSTVKTNVAVARPPAMTLSQSKWTIVSESHGVVLADRRSFREPDGNVVTIYRFRAGRTVFALHTGSEDPPGVAARVGPRAGPSISRAEAPHVIGAFNGGFKVASGSGGFEVTRRVFVKLLRGDASLVIDSNGAAHVGVWGQDLPYLGERVTSVRQNLQPLIKSGRISPLIGDLAAWGVTLGGVPAVARSAVGQDRQGNLLCAGSMRALPSDLARTLLAAGAVRAMELDINPYWVQIDSTPHPGGPLVAGVPNQERPGNQFVLGWTRDFVVVLARP